MAKNRFRGLEAPVAATIPIQIGGDLWNARVYASLAAASELAAEFDRPEDDSAHELDAEEACRFLNQLNIFLGKGLSLVDNFQIAPIGISQEKLVAARDSFLDLYRICERILTLSRNIRQLGQMKAELELLRAQSERLLDVVDWFDALSTPADIEQRFAAAQAELDSGEVIPMATLR